MTRVDAVVCVLSTPGEYTPLHVRALHATVKAHWPKTLPFRFVVLTDTPTHAGVEERPLIAKYSGWWSKMEIFAPQHLDLGNVLYLDLDTIVVGDLTPLLLEPQPTLLRDFYHLERAQSGLMCLPRDFRSIVGAVWAQAPNQLMQRYRGDGEFLDAMWRKDVTFWQDRCPNMVISFKATVKQTPGQVVPKEARVVCFHGLPRPWGTVLWKQYVEPLLDHEAH